MDEETQVENPVVPTATPEQNPEPSQEENPVKAELERVEKKPKRSKREQLEYTKKRLEEQLAELNKAEGVDIDDDSRPLTVGDLRRIEQERAVDTAMSLAESIQDEHERRLTKFHLENTIKPSGDAQTDLQNAVALVNAVKNRQTAEHMSMSAKARSSSSAPSAPPRETPEKPEFSKDDEAVIRGFGLTQEEAEAALKG